MSVAENLQKSAINSLTALFGHAFTEKDCQVNQTKPEFEGDYTVVLFSLVKSLKLSPDDIGTQLGDHLITNNLALFTKYNIAKTFSSFYTEHSIANAETANKKQLRLQLASMTANVIKSGMHLLGVTVPERM